MKKYTIKNIQAAYQMAYLEAKLAKNQNENTCGLCWESNCTCNYDHTKDSFITLTTVGEPQYV